MKFSSFINCGCPDHEMMKRSRFTRTLDENLHYVGTSSERVLHLIPQAMEDLLDDVVIGMYHAHEPGNTMLLSNSDDLF